MSQITFDTLKFAKKLKQSGVPDSQAEAQAEAFAEILSVSVDNLTTKEDLKHSVELLEASILATKEDLKHSVKLLEASIEKVRTDFAGKFQLLYWMMGFLLTGVIGMVALMIRLSLMR